MYVVDYPILEKPPVASARFAVLVARADGRMWRCVKWMDGIRTPMRWVEVLESSSTAWGSFEVLGTAYDDFERMQVEREAVASGITKTLVDGAL